MSYACMTDILNKLNKFSKIIIGLTAFTITFTSFSLLKVHAAPECTPEYKTSASHVPFFVRVEMNDCAVKEIVRTSQYSGGVAGVNAANPTCAWACSIVSAGYAALAYELEASNERCDNKGVVLHINYVFWTEDIC